MLFQGPKEPHNPPMQHFWHMKGCVFGGTRAILGVCSIIKSLWHPCTASCLLLPWSVCRLHCSSSVYKLHCFNFNFFKKCCEFSVLRWWESLKGVARGIVPCWYLPWKRYWRGGEWQHHKLDKGRDLQPGMHLTWDGQRVTGRRTLEWEASNFENISPFNGLIKFGRGLLGSLWKSDIKMAAELHGPSADHLNVTITWEWSTWREEWNQHRRCF